MKALTIFACAAVAFTSMSHSAISQGVNAEVHIFFRSFIKNIHPTKADDTIKTSSNTYVIKAPSFAPLPQLYPQLYGTCFSTDDRDFSINPTASARTTVEFIIKIKGLDMTVSKSQGRDMGRTGQTRNVDCKTGADLQPARRASSGKITVGDIKASGFFRTLFVKAAASDPFYDNPIFPAPDVDFSFTIRYNILNRTLEIDGSTDNFPAFEGYYSINGGEWQTILKRDPAPGATALSLIDANLGINTTNFSKEISLK